MPRAATASSARRRRRPCRERAGRFTCVKEQSAPNLPPGRARELCISLSLPSPSRDARAAARPIRIVVGGLGAARAR